MITITISLNLIAPLKHYIGTSFLLTIHVFVQYSLVAWSQNKRMCDVARDIRTREKPNALCYVGLNVTACVRCFNPCPEETTRIFSFCILTIVWLQGVIWHVSPCNLIALRY